MIEGKIAVRIHLDNDEFSTTLRLIGKEWAGKLAYQGLDLDVPTKGKVYLTAEFLDFGLVRMVAATRDFASSTMLNVDGKTLLRTLEDLLALSGHSALAWYMYNSNEEEVKTRWAKTLHNSAVAMKEHRRVMAELEKEAYA